MNREQLIRLIHPQQSLITYSDDVAQPNPVYPADTNFTIRYQGLYCREKAYDRFWGSNEPYVITSAVHINNQGENIVRTEKHPIGNPQGAYGGVDDKEFRDGPVAACWFGKAQTVALVVTAMEQDDGDPNAYKEEIDALLKAAAEIIVIATGISIPDSFIEALAILVNWFVGSEDDIIGINGITLNEYFLKVGGLPNSKVKYIDGNKTSPLKYYFLTRNNDSGDYFIFFDVEADKQPINLPGNVTPLTESDISRADNILIF